MVSLPCTSPSRAIGYVLAVASAALFALVVVLSAIVVPAAVLEIPLAFAFLALPLLRFLADGIVFFVLFLAWCLCIQV